MAQRDVLQICLKDQQNTHPGALMVSAWLPRGHIAFSTDLFWAPWGTGCLSSSRPYTPAAWPTSAVGPLGLECDLAASRCSSAGTSRSRFLSCSCKALSFLKMPSRGLWTWQWRGSPPPCAQPAVQKWPHHSPWPVVGSSCACDINVIIKLFFLFHYVCPLLMLSPVFVAIGLTVELRAREARVGNGD